jgi:hypothetical protein
MRVTLYTDVAGTDLAQIYNSPFYASVERTKQQCFEFTVPEEDLGTNKFTELADSEVSVIVSNPKNIEWS